MIKTNFWKTTAMECKVPNIPSKAKYLKNWRSTKDILTTLKKKMTSILSSLNSNNLNKKIGTLLHKLPSLSLLKTKLIQKQQSPICTMFPKSSMLSLLMNLLPFRNSVETIFTFLLILLIFWTKTIKRFPHLLHRKNYLFHQGKR